MFSKLMLCQSCHFKPRKLLICLAVLEVLVVLLVGIHYFSFRHRTVKGEPHLRETSQLHNSAGTIEVYDNEVAPYIHHLQGKICLPFYQNHFYVDSMFCKNQLVACNYAMMVFVLRSLSKLRLTILHYVGKWDTLGQFNMFLF